MILLLDRFYLLRCIMTSVMQCLPAQLPDLPTSALASLNESVLVQVSLATQANSKRPKQHLKLPKAQTFSIEDLPDEVTTALIYQNFLHQDLCSLAQVSWRYRHLSVSNGIQAGSTWYQSSGQPVGQRGIVLAVRRYAMGGLVQTSCWRHQRRNQRGSSTCTVVERALQVQNGVGQAGRALVRKTYQRVTRSCGEQLRVALCSRFADS